jgi:predicted unusual protein kinase regulating ubiquinone biosynthesis (AarF/ABC1/UbiB family)
VRRAAHTAISRWLAAHAGAVEDAPRARLPERRAGDPPGVVAALPRRKIEQRSSEPAQAAPAQVRRIAFRAGTLRTLTRMALWLWALLRYVSGTAVDLLTLRDTIQRRAARVRRIFEGLGPTFIKLGQQLSVRADFLPYDYCEELAKMLDKVPPFPTEQAIRTIERDFGRPLGEIFATFDPQPIGSASLACVYQALLHDGQRVAVKVRRPGISALLAADLRALGWLLRTGELLSLARAGISENLLIELQQMFADELNFYQEARFTELFRRFAEEQEQTYLSAPRVYFDLLSERVLCTEFVSGVFLWEIISALDRQDEAALADLRERGFDPSAIARNLVMAFNYEMVEGLFFHADPHPANIVVRPGNALVFIDFGSCGQITKKARHLWLETQRCIAERDVQGLVKCTISYMEPLPPIDLDKFIKEVEALYWNWIYAINSQHAEWWEKASGQLWMRFAGVAQRYNIPMNLDSLRMFRATFLYDTVMLRLWKHLDYPVEYRRYYQEAGDRARRRVRRAIKKRLKKGLTNSDYMQLEEMWRMGNQIMGRLQHALDLPQFSFSSMVGKMAFGVSTLLKLVAAGCAVYLVALIAVSGYRLITGVQMDLMAALRAVSGSRWVEPVLLLIALIMVRKVLVRLQDVDTNK